MQQMLSLFIKWSSLQKSLSEFMQKYFYEINPWTQSCKTFFGIIYGKIVVIRLHILRIYVKIGVIYTKRGFMRLAPELNLLMTVL